MAVSYTQYVYNSPDEGWSYGYLVPQVRAMLGQPGGAVIDLGCGNGAIALALLSLGYDVYGVDASASGIAFANAKAPGRFFVLDVSSGQLPEELVNMKFDFVISTEVIEHLYDPRGFIAFARRILGSDGQLILSTPYHGYLKNLALALTGKLDRHFTVLWDGGHIKFFSRRTLEKMLAEHGFESTGFAGAGRWPLMWKSMLIKARVIQ
jgi:2-polyprenyl-3-methyl-5-hydroxy-6-metoxy-1,4-benzoquinol methylase